MSKMFVKTGDTVVVLSGKSKGVKGEVIAVSPKEGKVIVKNVNKVTKHVKPRKMGDQADLSKLNQLFMLQKYSLYVLSATRLLV